ncbi:uncharacterized protein [Battus philenor]|uniref:uncharacterized protein n=1 Tax=Battus philenor TaxID=42288 RepID=UPI0035D1090C
MTQLKTEVQAVTDNELSSSSYSRGLLHHTDYGVHDYQEQIPYGYDYHDTGNYGHHGFQHHPPGPFYVNYDDHHGGNYANHHGDNHGGHHIGHHYKHNGHDLAAKTLLWPIAGIALLGAAAALVTNPVLLQLGVVSGRRKRRDTEEITEPGDIDIRKWLNKQDNSKNKLINLDRKIPSTLYKIHSKSQRMSKVFVKQYTKNVTLRKPSTDKNNIPIRSKLIEKMNYIQIPLKVKPSV